MRRFTTLRHMSSQPATGTGTGLVHEAIDFFGWKHFDVFFHMCVFSYLPGGRNKVGTSYIQENLDQTPIEPVVNVANKMVAWLHGPTERVVHLKELCLKLEFSA